MPTVFPDRVMVKLPYLALTGGDTVGFFDYQYRHNGCFDPEVAIGGHQPLAFDQWMSLYENFVVTGCKIRCDIAPHSAQDTTPFYTLLSANNNTTSINTEVLVQAAIEDKQRTTSPGIAQVAMRPVIIKRYFGTAKLYGIRKDGIMTDSGYWGDNATDPANPTRWHLVTFPFNYDVASTYSPSIKVQLTYYVTFLNRKELAIS